jgi:hypothetical protein
MGDPILSPCVALLFSGAAGPAIHLQERYLFSLLTAGPRLRAGGHPASLLARQTRRLADAVPVHHRSFRGAPNPGERGGEHVIGGLAVW